MTNDQNICNISVVKCGEMCLVNKREDSTRNGNYKMSVSLLIIFEGGIF
jgi:hypothetical protein